MMWSVAIGPSIEPSIPHEPTHQPVRCNVVYHLQPSCSLPPNDCVTTLKTRVFHNPRSLHLFNWFNHHSKSFINTSFLLGCIVACAFPGTTNVITGRILAMISSALLVVPLFTGYMIMRVDIIKLLVKTYEFWFITIYSIVTAILLSFYLNDSARALLPIVACVGYVRTFMVDANCSGARAMTTLLLFGALAVSVYMAGNVLNLVPATRSIELFAANGHVLVGEDVALNGLGIVLLVFYRNAFRKYTTAPRRRRSSGSGGTGRVRFMAYRARIKFVEWHEPAPVPLMVEQPVPEPISAPADASSSPPSADLTGPQTIENQTHLATVVPAESLSPPSMSTGLSRKKTGRRKMTQLMVMTPPTLYIVSCPSCPAA